MKRQIISLIITICIMTMLPLSSQAAADIWDGGTDILWHNSTDSEFTIRTAEQLAGLARLVNAGTDDFYGDTITLAEDINLAGSASKNPWTPIGQINPFKGTFDGGGHSISGLYIKTATEYNHGLFGYLLGGTIKNLTVSGTLDISTTTAVINIDKNAGGIVGLVESGSGSRATISGCTNNVTVSSSSTRSHIGGIVGYVEDRANIEKCTNNGDITCSSNQTAVGGIAGKIEGGTIFGCTNKGNIDGGVNIYVDQGTGGIVGFSKGDVVFCESTGNVVGRNYVGGIAGVNEGKVEDCTSRGAITGGSQLGGIVGRNEGTVLSCTKSGGSIIGNVSFDDIYDGQSNIGGIIGYNTGFGSVENCTNSSNVTGVAGIGGVIGSSYDNDTDPASTEVIGCSNSGTVVGSSFVGGVVGNSKFDVTDCFNTGNVTATGESSDVGGVVGNISTGTVKGCYNKGDVTASKKQGYAGGVAGSVSTDGKVIDCYNEGTVLAEGENSASAGVTGSTFTGGIVINCHNIGVVTNSGLSGRVAGIVVSNGTTNIVNCYNTGTLRTTSTNEDSFNSAGGIAAFNGGGKIINCYNTGSISLAVDGLIGGVVAINRSGYVNITPSELKEVYGVVENCYYMTGKGAETAVESNYFGNFVTNVGSFSSADFAITIDEYVDATPEIPSTNLHIALNAGAAIYNKTVTSATEKAYRWIGGGMPTLTSEPISGDATGDFIVGVEDLVAIAGDSYNMAVTQENEHLDINGDDKINFADLAMARNSKNFLK